MESSISQLRFNFPIDIVRPNGAARYELWAPKLKRRVTLFDQSHVKGQVRLDSFSISAREQAGIRRSFCWRWQDDHRLAEAFDCSLP